MGRIEQNRAAFKAALDAGSISLVRRIPVPPSVPVPVPDYPVQPGAPLRTPMPTSQVLQPDTQRTWYNSAGPQTRIPPQAFSATPIFGGGVVTQTNAVVSGFNPQLVPTPGSQSLTLNQIADTTQFARVTSTALTANQVDPTKVGVLSLGSRPQSITTPLTVVATTTTLTFYWDGTNGSVVLRLYRDNVGATVSGPYSGHQAVTGLTANTTYFVYPYFDENLQTVVFPAVAGGVGTPAIAYTAVNTLAAQQQILQHRVPLAPNFATTGFATPASGSSSGSGGSGGGGKGGGGQNYQ